MKNVNKEKVIKSLSANARRELEVLSHYCDIDYENKIVTVPSYFDNAEEIFTKNIGNKKHPFIQNEFLQDMSESIHCVPNAFDVSFNVTIKNYNGYTPECLMDAVQDGLEIFSYNVKKQMNANGIKKSLLIASGIIIFSWLFIICSLKIFGEEEVTHNIMHEIIYTIACVLLWEGIYILFLPDNEYKDVSYDILTKIRDIKFLDKKNHVLVKKSLKELKRDWVHETPWEKRFKRAFLLSATGYFSISLSCLPEIIPTIKNIATDQMNIVILISTIVTSIFLLFTAIANLSLYNGSGPLIKCTIPFNAISLVVIAGNFVVHIINFALYGKISIFWLVISILLIIVSVIGLCGAIALNKKKKK